MGWKMKSKNRIIQPAVKKERNIFGGRIRALRMFGCWPMFDTHKTKSEVIYSILCLLSIVNVISGTLLTLYALTDFAIAQGKIDQEVYNDIMLFVILLNILAKMILVTSKAQHIRKLIEELNGFMYDEFVVGEENEDVIKRCYKYDQKLSLFLLIFTSLLSASSVCRPMLKTIKRSMKMRAAFPNATSFPVVIGDLVSKYPFTLYAPSLEYVIVYIHQTIGTICGAVASWASDAMFCSILYYLGGHFDILINNIMSEHNERDYKNVSLQKERSMKIVNHHQFLMRYSHEIQKAFAPLMVLQMLLGAGTIGLLLIQLTLIDGDLLQYAKPASYLILKLLQLYMSSWHGQLLWDKSEQVANACYFSHWYYKPRSSCMDLKIIIARSQKPIKVSALGLFQFSARSFAGILNTAYSYFAMMRTMK